MHGQLCQMQQSPAENFYQAVFGSGNAGASPFVPVLGQSTLQRGLQGRLVEDTIGLKLPLPCMLTGYEEHI